MRAFLHLSVGLKLLTSSLLALAMLGGVAGIVALTGRDLSDTIARQDRLGQSAALLTEAMGTAAATPASVQAMLAANRLEEVEAARDAALAALDATAALARRAAETLMRSGPDNFTRELVDRTNLWLMETPQVFRARILRRAYQVVRERAEAVTDEVSAVALLGISTCLVESPCPNPKITLPGDIQCAEALLS